MNKGLKSKKLMVGLAKVLKAKYFFNTELKVTASKENYRKLINYYFEKAGQDNRLLYYHQSAEKTIIHLPKLRINFLEKVCGYKRIE